MIRIPTHRPPAHCGAMLAEEFQGLMQISQSHLADALYFRCQRINELVNQTRGITPSTTLRLARFSACRPISG